MINENWVSGGAHKFVISVVKIILNSRHYNVLQLFALR